MGKYQAYPAYKDSGVEWLGEIPEGWQKIFFKRVVGSIKDGTHGTHSRVSEGLPLLSAKNVYNHGIVIGQNESLISDKEHFEITKNGYPQKDDLLITCVGTIGRSFVYPFDYPISFQRSVTFLRLNKNAFPKFYKYFVESQPYQAQLEAYSKSSAQSGVYMGDLINTSTVLPPLPEQTQIANFLDHETARIDTLIAKQESLIALLKEKRQAVISHAVTKGLDPDVPMKDSGVDWLGEVPAHWDVTRLKYECTNIVDCLHSTPSYSESGTFPAIRTADITAGNLDYQGAKRVSKAVYDERNIRLVPRSGDIIYTREGERFGIGASIPEGVKVCLGQRVMLFRTPDTSDFLMWSLNSESTYQQAKQDVFGSTSPHVNVETIKNFYLAWPPQIEREIIGQHINQINQTMDSLILIANKKIALLKERRTALISAAVTGKIDVRDWTPSEPQIQREAVSV